MSLAWDESPAETVHPHQGWISGLLQLAGFLTDHPELPMPPSTCITYDTTGTPSQQAAMVREVGRILDVEPRWDSDLGYLTVDRQFGPIFVGALMFMQESGPAAAPTAELPAVVDVGAMPEVDCQPCEGKGFTDTGPQRAACPYCLGKGRILSWQPRHAAGAPAW